MENKMAVMEETTNRLEKCTDIFEERYYVINKRTLCFVGQWPYQSFLERSVRTVVLTLLTFTLLIPQILKLLQSWEDIDIFIECLSPLITNVGFTIKLVNLLSNTEQIKKLLDETRGNWEYMRRYPMEFEILREYGEKGRLYTLSYMMLINLIVTAWILTPLLTVLMDYISPLNESRPHLVLFQADYKLDPDKYFYLILLHGSIVCAVGIQMFVSNDTLYMSLSQHACGMIEVLRYRLENITKENERINATFKKAVRDGHDQLIVSCIKRHKRIISYIRLIESTCEWCLVFVIALNMLVMSCTGARVVAKGTAPQDVVRFAFFTLAQVTHLFCNSLPGHWIMQSSSLVGNSVYSCNWYLMPPKSRKLLVLFIQQCVKPCTITAGKIYVMSMENFCAVLQTSMSYLTMLTSMQ